MAPDAETTRAAEAVVRALTTAAKTLRLYPAASPIPLQAMQAASEALGGVLAAESSVSLIVARDGFTYRGERIATPGASDLADLLTAHEVAGVDLVPGCTTHDLSTFLTTLLRDPADVRAEGGFSAVLAHGGVTSVSISEVVLTAAAAEMPDDVDVDAFLRELATDEARLAAWLAAAASGDPAMLAEDWPNSPGLRDRRGPPRSPAHSAGRSSDKRPQAVTRSSGLRSTTRTAHTFFERCCIRWSRTTSQRLSLTGCTPTTCSPCQTSSRRCHTPRCSRRSSTRSDPCSPKADTATASLRSSAT